MDKETKELLKRTLDMTDDKQLLKFAKSYANKNQDFAEAIIENPAVLKSLIDNFNEGRNYLIETLDANGYAHKGEAGNFIFIKTNTDAQKIVKRMKEDKKILIKSYPNVGEFGTCLRVSIGEKKYMQQFCNALFELDK